MRFANSFCSTCHNLSEGAAVAVSIFSATRSKTKAFVGAAVSGLTEPLAVVLGYFFLAGITPYANALSLAGVAGVMMSLVLFELLPIAAKSNDYQWWLVGGACLTALPVLMF